MDLYDVNMKTYEAVENNWSCYKQRKQATLNKIEEVYTPIFEYYMEDIGIPAPVDLIKYLSLEFNRLNYEEWLTKLLNDLTSALGVIKSTNQETYQGEGLPSIIEWLLTIKL